MAKKSTENKQMPSTDKHEVASEGKEFEGNGLFMRKGQMLEVPEPLGVTHDDLGFSAEQVLEMYRSMLLQRRFERRAKQMYMRAKIAGFLHLYIGQEAVSTGSVMAAREDDPIITAYRDHGLALARGMSPKAGMAELYGRIDGCSRGKGGSMHFFSREHEFYGGHGIVGGCIPLGVGIAFALKYREEERACLTFFGDGATNIGTFHEAANLAGLYGLPVVLIIENNDYAMGTSVIRSAAEPELYKRATSYGMKGRVVNGMDVFSVYKAVSEHLEMARAGKPSLLEIRTYRYEGHSMSDPAHYRSKEEVEDFKGRDPLENITNYIQKHEIGDNQVLEKIDDEVKAQVQEAVEFAENSPFPPEETIYEDIYEQEDFPFLTD
jgi:pyruvate dehydrogenase E1 component alpha subunit